MQDTSSDRIFEIANDTVAQFPHDFASSAAEVVLLVEEIATPELLRDMGISDPLELSGLYEGIPVTHKSVFDQPVGPDTVTLFRRAILDELASRPDETLETLVAHVTVHEFAHHFGWSDEDIAAIDEWWT